VWLSGNEDFCNREGVAVFEGDFLRGCDRRKASGREEEKRKPGAKKTSEPHRNLSGGKV